MIAPPFLLFGPPARWRGRVDGSCQEQAKTLERICSLWVRWISTKGSILPVVQYLGCCFPKGRWY